MKIITFQSENSTPGMRWAAMFVQSISKNGKRVADPLPVTFFGRTEAEVITRADTWLAAERQRETPRPRKGVAA